MRAQRAWSIVARAQPAELAAANQGRQAQGAVTSGVRSSAVPDLPTIAEAGGAPLKGFEASSWFGLLVPAGTPKDVVTKVNGEVAKWLATPEAKEKLAAQGANVATGLTPDDFTRHIASETAKWQKVVKDSGAKVE